LLLLGFEKGHHTAKFSIESVPLKDQRAGMLHNICLRQGNTIFLLITLGLICLIFSCAPAPSIRTAPTPVEEAPAQIESINVISGPNDRETTIEIASSRAVPYAAFKLAQPLRLIVDIDAPRATGLTEVSINGKIVEDIHLESIEDRPTATRVIATLSQDVEYNVREKAGTITVLLSAKEPIEKAEAPVLAAKEEDVGPTEPRLFFSPGKIKLNQILGIDFFMLPEGRSRVIVTTSKRAEYELSQKNSLTLLLHIKGAIVPRELTRYIDSSYFKGAVNQITPIVKVAQREVDLEIRLKEMVPYQLMQTDTEIRLDFDKTSVKPPARKITPTRLREAGVMPPISAPRPPRYKRYKGGRITLDLVNADIRNILKLMGEVGKRNIVWGPEVKGTVSMRLKDVPWDQALDMVLEANDLGILMKQEDIRVNRW
jgi:hypothetical protein